MYGMNSTKHTDLNFNFSRLSGFVTISPVAPVLHQIMMPSGVSDLDIACQRSLLGIGEFATFAGDCCRLS